MTHNKTEISVESNMDDLVRKTYNERYCDENGNQKGPVFFERFRTKMLDTHPDPDSRAELRLALRRSYT